MKKILQGHRALITGASSGIGKEFARQLASMGVDLVIAARRSDRLLQLANDLKNQYHVTVDCVAIDLSLSGAAKILFEKATGHDGLITILVNNAGVGRYGAFLDFALSDHLATLQVNAVTLTELTYLCAKHMLWHKKVSYIAQISSISAFQPTSNFTVYSGTKGYSRYFSETLAFELKNTNIHCTCICPGGTYTEFLQHAGQELTTSGHMTMMSCEKVVHLSILAILKKKSVYVPGILNKLACFLPRLLPSSLAIAIAYATMSRAVKRVPPQKSEIL